LEATSEQQDFLKALTEEIQIVDAKRIVITKTTKLSGLWLKVLIHVFDKRILYMQ